MGGQMFLYHPGISNFVQDLFFYVFYLFPCHFSPKMKLRRTDTTNLVADAT